LPTMKPIPSSSDRVRSPTLNTCTRTYQITPHILILDQQKMTESWFSDEFFASYVGKHLPSPFRPFWGVAFPILGLTCPVIRANLPQLAMMQHSFIVGSRSGTFRNLCWWQFLLPDPDYLINTDFATFGECYSKFLGSWVLQISTSDLCYRPLR
jgi:hypothetical protein